MIKCKTAHPLSSNSYCGCFSRLPLSGHHPLTTSPSGSGTDSSVGLEGLWWHRTGEGVWVFRYYSYCKPHVDRHLLNHIIPMRIFITLFFHHMSFLPPGLNNNPIVLCPSHYFRCLVLFSPTLPVILISTLRATLCQTPLNL